MSNQEFKSFDIKLTDGRYFKNVLVCCDGDFEYSKKEILDNQYTNEDGKVINVKMDLYHINTIDSCNIPLITIYSEGIEYIGNSYKDREVI